MKHKIKFSLLLLLFAAHALHGQTQVQGKVSDGSTGEPILVGIVALYKSGSLITGTDTDFDGNYFFSDVDPGTYDIEVSCVGYANQRIADVVVKAGKVTIVDVAISEGIEMPNCYILNYKVPLIDFWDTTSGMIFTSELLEELHIK